MRRIINNKYTILTILCTFIYIVLLNIMKIYPFGENSILKSDMYKQYINFFCYLKQIIVNNKSIIMSWNLGLANNFYTTFAYYLISPINILVIFFNSNNMDLCLEIIILIKIILMANFMVLFLEKSYNYKKKENIVFGLIYAYSSYVICYSFHIMWLDCIYMLPIILMYIDNFLKTGKISKLIASLSYAIITNYYMGFIVAFYSGIYFLVKCFCKYKKFSEFFKDYKIILKFLLAIFISFTIGMIVIFPSLLQLGGKMKMETKLFEWDIEKIQEIKNAAFNNYTYEATQKVGMLFSSTFVILLIPMFYLNKTIYKKEKLGFTAIILFLMLPIFSPFLYKIWHCFTTPNCFNFRYSFTLIFTLILMSARGLQEIKYSYFFQKKCGHYKELSKMILIIIVITDIVIGGFNGLNSSYDKYMKRATINKYDNFMNYFMQKLDVPEVKRIVFEPDIYGSNMSLKYGYSNIGFFSSARNRETLKAMYRLGYNVQMEEQLWITSFSGTFLNYSIAGVKYYITEKDLKKSEIPGFEFEETYDGLNIYKNKNAFDIGFYLEKNIEESYNPFKMQNELLNYNLENNKEYFQNIENSDFLDCTKSISELDEYTINYRVKANKNCNIYLMSDYNLQLYINEVPQFENYSNIWGYETGIKNIRHLEKDEEFEFTIKTKQNLELLYIYASDNEMVEKDLNNDMKKFELKNIKKNGLVGTANFENAGYLAFSINYDKSWKIYVDGVKQSAEAIAGCFLGVNLEKGKHKIEVTKYLL